MKVLIIGSGGREHALVWKIAQSKLTPEIFCAPGNGGTGRIAKNVSISANDIEALVNFAETEKIDFTIVGPDSPAPLGITEKFKEKKLKIFAPSQAASQLEASKGFAKEILLAAGVRTAKSAFFDNLEEAKSYVTQHDLPIVVKANGLAEGKGVIIAQSVEEAIKALEDIFVHQVFGSDNNQVLIEQFIVGEEASLIAIVDGQKYYPLVVGRDHKRVFDGDKGLNTGGMGVVSPSAKLSQSEAEKYMAEIFPPVLKELQRRGIYYQGFLYAGVMFDGQGNANVIEFNCRLGDPEAQVIVMRLKSDLLSCLIAVVDGQEKGRELSWTEDAAACVVLCSEGYPEKPLTNREIMGLENIEENPRLVLFHAGSRYEEESNKYYTKGGRVIGVTALGKDIDEALERAYSAVKAISFEGMHYRKDIGKL